jgi:hypothetical protein
LSAGRMRFTYVGVIPAQAGIRCAKRKRRNRIPAFAGMTVKRG